VKRCLLLLLLAAAAAQADEAEQVFNTVRHSVVSITVFDERKQVDGEGSGIVLGPGRVITNCHVVQEANAIRVRAADKEYDATLNWADTPRDLCRLDVPGLSAPAAKIRSYREVQTGERAYAVGNPLGFGLAVSAGLVSAIGEHKGQLRLYSSAAISPGSSGGGLFDGQGRLIGITTGFYPGAQNLNLALPADWIDELPKHGVAWHAQAASIPDPNWLGDAESLRVANKWTELEALARHWREAYPTSAAANVYLGMALANEKQFEAAKEVLLQALQQDPNYPTALSILAHARYQLGEKEAAMADLQRAISMAPTSGPYYFALASWRVAQGDIDGAVDATQTAIRFEPGSEFNWRLFGALRQDQKRYAEAAQAYRTALRLKPDEATARHLAEVLAAMGEPEEARRVLTSAGLESSISASSWIAIGAAQEKEKHFTEAERAYRKALALEPTSGPAWYGLGSYLLRVARSTEAEEALRQAVNCKPDLGMAWLGLGDLARQRGDNKSAAEDYEKATTFLPSLAGAWLGLGGARKALKDYTGAAAALDEAVRFDPKNANALALSGEMQLVTGRAEMALKTLQEAERIDPKNELVLQALSMYYGRVGDQTKALAYALRALEINPSVAYNWNNKGYALLKLGRHAEAIQSLETATRLEPDMVAAQINLGEAYLRTKQLGKAITTLEQALKLAPKAVDARLYVAEAYAGSGQFAQARQHLQALLRQSPNLPAAWAMMTIVGLTEGNQADALAAYDKLKAINPAMAHQLSRTYRIQRPLSVITLPD
jgi:tetratricopeptide (TPR) repeat protein